MVTAAERGWQALDDESLLVNCAAEGRVLLTNNVADFAVLARQWQAEGRHHAGLVFTSDSSMPRTRRTVGRYVTALHALMSRHPDASDLADQVHWL